MVVPLSSMAHMYNIYVLDCRLSIQPDKQNSSRESAPPSASSALPLCPFHIHLTQSPPPFQQPSYITDWDDVPLVPTFVTTVVKCSNAEVS